MKECREFLHSHLDTAEQQDFIQKCLIKEMRSREITNIDVMAYLDREEYSDEETDAVINNSAEKPLVIDADAQSMLSLSDSEAENSDIEEENVSHVKMKVKCTGSIMDNKLSSNVEAVETIVTKTWTISEKMQRCYDRLGPQFLAPRSSRASLVAQLKVKVMNIAKENYCQQKHIEAEQLTVRIQLAEKCRYNRLYTSLYMNLCIGHIYEYHMY